MLVPAERRNLTGIEEKEFVGYLSDHSLDIIVNPSEVTKDRRKMISKTMFFGALFLVYAVWTQTSYGSAIPMWEYLGRGEKVNRRHHITGFITTYSHITIILSWSHPALEASVGLII